MLSSRKIKVLVVDDSKLMREMLSLILSKEVDIEIIGLAADPYEAVEIMKNIKPDVITLDIEMPKMDGLTFLKKIMRQHPIPVIIISSLTLESAQISMHALELGAVEIISKPFNKSLCGLNPNEYISNQIRRAANSKVVMKNALKNKNKPIINFSKGNKKIATRIICIGASTGGTIAIRKLIEEITPEMPAIVIIQHMPPIFTKAFADNLNKSCQLEIKEAEEDEILINNHVYIAPGGKHLMVIKTSQGIKVHLTETAPVNFVKPSIDVAMESMKNMGGKENIAIILTGMGSDGAIGLKTLKDNGWTTIAQDEESSLIYGMPKKAFELGAAKMVMNITEIKEFITTKTYV